MEKVKEKSVVKNDMKLIMLSQLRNELVVKAAISQFVELYNPSEEEQFDITTAVFEAVNNCMIHAYRDETGKIEVNARKMSDDNIYVKISDKGCGIDNVDVAQEPLYTSQPKHAGLGFSVMQSLMDNLKVRSTLGKGTTVIMRRHLSLKQQ